MALGALLGAATLLAYVLARSWNALRGDATAPRLFLVDAPRDLEFGSAGRLSAAWQPPGGFPASSTWRARPLSLPAPLRALVEQHWVGWTVDAWDLWPQDGEPFELSLFDVRTPAAPLLERSFPGATGTIRLGVAQRLESADIGGRPIRCAEFQLLSFDEDSVRVLDTRTCSGSWLPPVDERKPQGWRLDPPCGREFGGPWAPMLAWWSWNGEASVSFAANVLWPRKARTFSTAVFDDREEAARRLPLATWPFPTLVLSVARPEVSVLPSRSPLELSSRFASPTQLAEVAPPGDLRIFEGLRISTYVDAENSERVISARSSAAWRTHRFVLDDRAGELIAEHWRGWTIDAWALEPPNDAPFELSLFEVRKPNSSLLKQTFARPPALIGAAYRLGSTDRAGHPERCARFQLLTFETNGVRVLATCEWSGDWLPPADMQEPAGWRRPLEPEWVFGGKLHPVLASWSWNGERSASMAANVLWPSKAPVQFTTLFDERERVAWNAPLPAWPFPTLVLAVEPPEITNPSEIEGPRQLSGRR